MSATTCMSSPTVQPIRSWSDIIEAYRPAAMAQRRSARTRRPRVSLCISAFQAERHLQETIDSCLAQHYSELELLIVDNNSSDGARDILEAARDDRVRIIRSATTAPISDSFNLAVEQSNGQFVKLICAGDTLQPDCIARQAKLLEGNPDVALVAVRTDRVDDEGKLLTGACGLVGLVGRHSSEGAIRRIARSGADPIGPPISGLFRRIDFDRCGGCRGDLLFPMDMGLWIRLLGHGDFLGVPDTLASSRIRSGSMAAAIRRASHRTSPQVGNQ
jgi:glycosyltransferase involved in cell wall biosynthesis